MKTAVRAAWVVAFGVLLAGCQQATSINEQVHEAIAEHVANRGDIDASRMTIEVETVSVQGDQAEAEVIFRSRDTPESRMNFHYELRREDGRWQVESGRPTAVGSPHPGGSPEGGMPLPEGHPPVGGGQGE